MLTSCCIVAAGAQNGPPTPWVDSAPSSSSSVQLTCRSCSQAGKSVPPLCLLVVYACLPWYIPCCMFAWGGLCSLLVCVPSQYSKSHCASSGVALVNKRISTRSDVGSISYRFCTDALLLLFIAKWLDLQFRVLLCSKVRTLQALRLSS